MPSREPVGNRSKMTTKTREAPVPVLVLGTGNQLISVGGGGVEINWFRSRLKGGF